LPKLIGRYHILSVVVPGLVPGIPIAAFIKKAWMGIKSGQARFCI
jgi:hypothetical protein